MTAWTPSLIPTNYVIGHVVAVLPDRLVDDARVVVREGRIAEVGPHRAGASCDLNGRGAALLPGLIDVHSDVLAREVRPRPGTTLDASFALASAGARLRAAGVTTCFHGLAFQQRSIVGMPIGSPDASDLAAALVEPDDGEVDHRVLYRLDIRCPYGRELLEKQLPQVPKGAGPPVVSHEDHTPGQGQFSDLQAMVRWLVTGEGMTEAQAVEHVAWWREHRNQRLDIHEQTLTWLGDLAHAGHIRLFGHDLATAGEVDALAERGGAVAEFPTTLDSARRARELGLLVVAGAPNVVRGGSHTGNVSASELVAEGLVDALASDYLPGAMLPAAMRLARDGALSLPQAVGLLTSGPAACVGLPDRGAIREGAVADLVLADLDRPWPVVHLIAR